MSNGEYRARRRGLMGPLILITIGVLFLADRFVPGVHFGRLWPVLLIVIGAIKLWESFGARGENNPPSMGGGVPPGA